MQIEFKNVHFEYRSPMIGSSRKALSGLSFTIRKGELVAVVGASGSGKTTLVQHFNGLLKPTSGQIIIGEQDISQDKTDHHAIRKQVGIVFQFPENQLFEETVADDIAFGPRNLNWNSTRIDRSVRSSLMLVGLSETFLTRNPFHLSGGEKRRVAIAGVLAMDPSILILDEPTSGLDWSGVEKIESVIRQYHHMGRTVVFVSHDMNLVARLADRILILKQGRLVFDGLKPDLFKQESLVIDSGLEIPSIVSKVRQLKQTGMHLEGCYSLEEVKDALMRDLGGPSK
jgi:energy-coupling factor transport system ATP-binding protein